MPKITPEEIKMIIDPFSASFFGFWLNKKEIDLSHMNSAILGLQNQNFNENVVFGS